MGSPGNPLRDKGNGREPAVFKTVFLTVQELSIPKQTKLNEGGRKPAWLKKRPVGQTEG